MGRINEKMKEIRKNLGLNQAAFSKKLGIGERTYARYESGERHIPSNILLEVAQMGNIDMNWLFGSDYEDKNVEKVESPDNIYTVPILSVRASAGSAGSILSAIDRFDTSQKLQVDRVLFKTPPRGTVRAVQIDCHSMIPMLYPDAWVLFDETADYRGDGLYVINWQDILMVKLLQVDMSTGHLHIKSVNPEYQSWEVQSASQEIFHIVGKVLRTII